MENSKIQWTHHTFNPWRGCVKVSAGCQHCYAETLSKRWGNDIWGVDKPRIVASKSYWKQPHKWNKDAEEAGERRRVFCASMADVFEDRPELEAPRMRMFELIEQTDWLDWLLLTKRPENILRLVPAAWRAGYAPANAWFGATAENQPMADKRVPELLQVRQQMPVPILFLSCEPMLGPVNLTLHGLPDWDEDWHLESLTGREWASPRDDSAPKPNAARIHWVICGGESGAGARPMAIEWARSLRDQCKTAGVPFFMKQLGGVRDKRGEFEDMPEDLRVREFPQPVTA